MSEHFNRRPTAPSLGVTWGGQPLHARRAATIAAAAAVVFGMAAPVTAQAATSAEPVTVIVRELDGAGNAPERAVEALGGTVGRSLDLIHGFTASVPADRLDALRTAAGVYAVTEDATLTLSSAEVDNQVGQPGSMHTIATRLTGAGAMWDAGYTGRGVDVAVIDSGVVPVNGLRTPGKVVNAPDLSFDGRICGLVGGKCANSPAYALDTYGHGTNIAGIIAGRDDAAPATVTSQTRSDFVGMAPDARIVNVKVADAGGRADVSQAIAAIDWVIQNRRANGLNIRVLNLSFGTDGVQDYQLDPLTFAAEQAWLQGLVVVVAAGNDGSGTGKLNNPAYDPYVIAVGGADTRGTVGTDDDVVPAWSSTGDGVRNPDVVAPGTSVVSLRDPGSSLDTQYPAARIGERFFRGSGTSQAAAVVTGAAALLLQQRPDARPDQIKALLTGTARKLPAADAKAQGNGLIDLAAARGAATPAAVQNFPRATGLGSLEAARGSVHVSVDGNVVKGEADIRGRAWNASTWAKGLKAGTNWNGVTWSGVTWSGVTWSGVTWSGVTWSGVTWSGVTWSGVTWSGVTWSGVTWSGVTWSGVTWSSDSWA